MKDTSSGSPFVRPLVLTQSERIEAFVFESAMMGFSPPSIAVFAKPPAVMNRNIWLMTLCFRDEKSIENSPESPTSLSEKAPSPSLAFSR